MSLVPQSTNKDDRFIWQYTLHKIMRIQEKEHNIQNIFGIIFMAFNVPNDVCYAKNKGKSNH